MDYQEIFANAAENHKRALADATNWLKQLETSGASVTDLDNRIRILQAVSKKLSAEAKVSLSDIDIEKTFQEANPYNGFLSNMVCSVGK